MSTKKINIAFAGQPNTGKSTLFNMLTGSYQHVANYPGITVEKKTGEFSYKNERYLITDLPGTYSLTSYSPEERVSRDFILNEKPEMLVNITDGSNLERQLYLTFQLLEMECPTVMYMNKLDVAEHNGLIIDQELLSKELGIPIVSGSAKKKQNLDLLKQHIASLAAQKTEQKSEQKKGQKAFQIQYGQQMEVYLAELVRMLEKNRKKESDTQIPLRWLAVKLCEHDEKAVKDCAALFENFDAVLTKIAEFEAEHIQNTKHNFEIEIAIARSKEAKRIVRTCVKKVVPDEKSVKERNTKKTISEFAALVVLYGVTVSILVSICGMFDKLFYMESYVKLIISVVLAVPYIWGAARIYLKSGDSINATDRVDRVLCHRIYGPLILVELILVFYWVTVSLGYKLTDKVFPFFRFVRSLVSQLLPALGLVAEGHVRGLFLSGIIDGAIMILNYVPIFFCLFALVAFLEDVGYMARLAFIMDRILRKFGLHGQSTLPMILSGVIMGGCVVPGVMSTRTIRDDKSRLVTILILPLLNCMAKIPFYVLMCGIFFPRSQWLVLGGLSFFTLIVALIMAKFFSCYIVSGVPEPFVLELPAYNMPTFSGILIRTWERLWSFIKKVATTVVAVSVVIWFGITFPSLNKQTTADFEMQKEQTIQDFAAQLKPSYAQFFNTEKGIITYNKLEERASIVNALNWFGGAEGQQKNIAKMVLKNPEYTKVFLRGRVDLGKDIKKFKKYYEAYLEESNAFADLCDGKDETEIQVLRSDFNKKWTEVNPYFFAIVRSGGEFEIKGTFAIDVDASRISREMRTLSSDIKSIAREYRKATLENSLLGTLGRLMEPVTQFAGFDWRVNVAVLGAFAAKEALVSTLGTIYSLESDDSADGVELEARLKNKETGLTPLDGLVVMLLIALFPPCVATMIAIKTETQSWKWTMFTVVYPVLLGGTVATLVYQVGRLLAF